MHFQLLPLLLFLRCSVVSLSLTFIPLMVNKTTFGLGVKLDFPDFGFQISAN